MLSSLALELGLTPTAPRWTRVLCPNSDKTLLPWGHPAMGTPCPSGSLFRKRPAPAPSCLADQDGAEY